MAGKRILDAAKLFDASKGVAANHIRIRKDQLNAWSDTSSLAKTVKDQTDRLTVTLQAARALSRRLEEQGPIWQTEIARRKDELAKSVNDSVTKSSGNVRDTEKEEVKKESARGSTSDNAEDDGTLSSLRKRELQRLAERQIPAQSADDHAGTDQQSAGSDTFSDRPQHTSPELSSLPRQKLPRISVDIQDDDDPSIIHGDSYNHRPLSDAEQAPEDVNVDVFSNPRVSRMLSQTGKKPMDPYVNRQKLPPKPLPEMLATQEKRKRETAVPLTTEIGPDYERGQSSTGSTDAETQALAASLTEDSAAQHDQPQFDAPQETTSTTHEMRESKVPASRFGRIWEYSGLATSMAFGALNEGLRRVTGSGAVGSLVLSEANMNRLVAKLSRMRGAALKLGQMMSFQDSKVLPPAINEVLQRVQDSADYMPASQRDKVLSANLGDTWRELFSSFEEKPFAAASIGQVHKATLAANGKDVAVKIQYPGVRNSIDSDLNNLSLLLTASRLLPRGLFLDKTIANARTELGWECDYEREADAGRRFQELTADERDIFTVPEVYAEASGADVLTAEYMTGTAVTKIPDLTQDERDWIGTQILRLCLRELMEWRFMQTDPNWTNFLYNRSSNRIELLDFGASREFPDKFVEPYVALLIAASRGDRETCRERSIELGYLTGHESTAMLEAHVDSILTLAEPFTDTAPEVYDFKDQTITDRVRSNIGLMLRERLAPPPEETYSLHRKLSGAFLLCARLQSRIRTKDMFEDAVRVWEGRAQKMHTPS